MFGSAPAPPKRSDRITLTRARARLAPVERGELRLREGTPIHRSPNNHISGAVGQHKVRNGDPFDLKRFVDAQRGGVYEQALS